MFRLLVFRLFFLAFFVFSTLNQALAEEERWYSLSAAWQDLISPRHEPARYYLLGGMLTAWVLWKTDRNLVDRTQIELSQKQPLGDSAKFGDEAGKVWPNLIYFGAYLYDYWSEKDSHSLYRAGLMFRATAYSSAVTLVTKMIVSERRPNGADRFSFPSGHTTTAFAFAAVVGREHHWGWAAAAYSLATFVGVSRINDNAHYLHDVIAGASLGIAYGVGLSVRDRGLGHSHAWHPYLVPHASGTTLLGASFEF